MNIKKTDTLLKIAQLGLKGEKSNLLLFLKEVAADEMSRGHHRIYNKILDLVEGYSKDFQISASSIISNQGEVPKAFKQNFWLSEKVGKKVERFIALQKSGLASQSSVPNLNKLLLFGPPGTGKTTLGFYIADQLDKELLYVKISDVISSRLGETTKNIEEVFRRGKGSVVFFDEFDAVAKARTDSNDVGELKRIVNSIIQTLDFHSHDMVVIVSTNLIETLDPAILRRFGYQIHMNFLSDPEIKAFVDHVIQHEDRVEYRFDQNEKLMALMLLQMLHLRSVDQIRLLFDKAIIDALLQKKSEVTLDNLISTLVDYDYIGPLNVRRIRKESPKHLSKLCEHLEKMGYSKVKISSMLGIHRNSYLKYAEEV